MEKEPAADFSKSKKLYDRCNPRFTEKKKKKGF